MFSQILICGEEIPEKLSHDIACLLGHATADTVIPSVVNSNNCESHNQRSKVLDAINYKEER